MDTLADEIEIADRPPVPGLSIDWTKPLPAWTGVPAPTETP